MRERQREREKKKKNDGVRMRQIRSASFDV